MYPGHHPIRRRRLKRVPAASSAPPSWRLLVTRPRRVSPLDAPHLPRRDLRRRGACPRTGSRLACRGRRLLLLSGAAVSRRATASMVHPHRGGLPRPARSRYLRAAARLRCLRLMDVNPRSCAVMRPGHRPPPDLRLLDSNAHPTRSLDHRGVLDAGPPPVFFPWLRGRVPNSRALAAAAVHRLSSGGPPRHRASAAGRWRRRPRPPCSSVDESAIRRSCRAAPPLPRGHLPRGAHAMISGPSPGFLPCVNDQLDWPLHEPTRCRQQRGRRRSTFRRRCRTSWAGRESVLGDPRHSSGRRPPWPRGSGSSTACRRPTAAADGLLRRRSAGICRPACPPLLRPSALGAAYRYLWVWAPRCADAPFDSRSTPARGSAP